MNTFGKMFKVTTWGESHGKANGCVIDGCPAGLILNKADIENELINDVPDKDIGTPRKEQNNFEILSGVFNNVTLGTPISIIIYNKDVKSKPYTETKNLIRPGHADYTYMVKYGNVDYRGGSRASGRECIARLAAGAVAKKLLDTTLNNICIESRVIELAGIEINNDSDYQRAKDKVLSIGKHGDSSGGKIELVIKNMPAGLGLPVFDKISSRLIYALSTIGGVKAVEIGDGITASRLKGSEMNDGFEIKNGKIQTITNHCGGILGGITTGSDIILRLSVKPTPTIFKKQHTVTKNLEDVIVSFEGRHDMNFTPRVCPVAENMAAITIVDFLMLSGKINRDSILIENKCELESQTKNIKGAIA